MATIQNPNGSASSGSSSSAGRRKPGSTSSEQCPYAGTYGGYLPDPVNTADLPQNNKDHKKMWLILGSIVVALIVAVVVAIAVTQ